MLKSRLARALALALLLFTLPAAALLARQAPPAPLSGTIYDTAGGVMPGVAVTLVDAAGLRRSVTSNSSGRFDFPAVAPGMYVLETKLAGFGSLRQELDLSPARNRDVAVTLQVGQLQETVSIRGRRAGQDPQAQLPSAARPVRVGGVVQAPLKVLDERPVYPATMRDAGLSGVVPIEAVIGRDGSVSAVRVMSAQVHPDFAIAAADAVRKWRYSPTLLNGVPVEVVMTVTVQFDLER
jgi:TonB family protein